jgi:UDPglucose 6-dehydrogenase
MRLAIFGSGYAGLVTSVCFAELGHAVTAIDKDPNLVARLSNGVPTIHEPGLAQLLTKLLEMGGRYAELYELQFRRQTLVQAAQSQPSYR